METLKKKPEDTRFDKNWAKYMMESAHRWEDLSDVILYTGIDLVDNDHRVLVEYAIEFNRLFDAAGDEGFDLSFIEKMQKQFKQLFDFTKEHFSREQALIKRLGIPGIGKQRSEHKRFLTNLENYIAEIESGRLNMALQFKSTFMEWLTDHINYIDYETFRLDKIGPIVLSKAKKWEDTAEMIRSMGLNDIDKDHRIITEYALEMNNLMDSELASLLEEVPDPLIEILEKLRTATRNHFDREEAMIRKYGLKLLEKQTAEHNWFVRQIGYSIDDLKAGEKVNLESLRNSILDWWVKHINVLDFATFKQENWMADFLRGASDWDDVADTVQPMNIESIDEQHRIQTEYILHLNNLLDAEKTRASDPELIQQIIEETKKIHRFAARHFEHEEEIMEKLEAPNQSTHISEHKEILRKIQNYIDNVTSGKIMVSMKLKILLAEWWINHINYTDFKSFRESRPSLIFHVEPGDPT